MAIYLGNQKVNVNLKDIIASDKHNYELVTVSQSCSNAEEARIALETFIEPEHQIVLFIRDDYTKELDADTPNNMGLLFFWSVFFSTEQNKKHLWARWRDNAYYIS